jgi:hypothetical protein
VDDRTVFKAKNVMGGARRRNARCVFADSAFDKAYNAATSPAISRKSIPRKETTMDERTREPVKITAEDINPRYNWGRHLPVLGTMGVDFEERVDYRRMHRYRLGRAQAALEASDLGALLLFDDNNIRYVTSTKIGEWARDKLSRWVLLTRGGDPILWDFGSAAVHHKLYSPWLKPENCKAGLVGLRGTVDPAFGLMKRHAEEMASILKTAGVAKMPIGVDIIEPPMMFELEKAGLKIKDGQQIMLSAREVKSTDEIALLNRAAAMVDGAYDVVNEMLRPGIRENDIVAEVNKFLHGLSHLLLPHLQCRAGDAGPARRVPEGPRVARQRDCAHQTWRQHCAHLRSISQGQRIRLPR